MVPPAAECQGLLFNFSTGRSPATESPHRRISENEELENLLRRDVENGALAMTTLKRAARHRRPTGPTHLRRTGNAVSVRIFFVASMSRKLESALCESRLEFFEGETLRSPAKMPRVMFL